MSLLFRLRPAPSCLRSQVSLRVTGPLLNRSLLKHHDKTNITLLTRSFSSTRPALLRSSAVLRYVASSSTPVDPKRGPEDKEGVPDNTPTIHENIYTIPNLLTVSRIIACPAIGYAILHDQFWLSTSLLAYASMSDWLDGFLARKFNMRSVVGTILDPAADKTLMTTLTITLAMKDLLPLPLAVIILGRDVLLSLSAFWIRYTSLPEPKTFSRYWDFSIPSAEVRPTQISKYNTALQLLLMFSTATAPIIPLNLAPALTGLQYIVATTTIWSGLSYVFSKDAYRVVAKTRKTGPPPPPVA